VIGQTDAARVEESTADDTAPGVMDDGGPSRTRWSSPSFKAKQVTANLAAACTVNDVFHELSSLTIPILT
jgi:hypothetical protein